MFQSLDLFGLSCLFLALPCQCLGGQILQPQNVSLEWVSDFRVKLSWARPQDFREGCEYVVNSSSDTSPTFLTTPSWISNVKTNRGVLQVSVKTVCGSNESLPVNKNFTYPELVQDLKCIIHSSNYSRCSWIPVSQYSPSFFYQFINEGEQNEIFPLKACSLSIYDGRTGCDLPEEVKTFYRIRILINETRDNEPNKNIFSLDFQVKPHALNWTVANAGNEFIINWTPLGLGGERFTISYTACNENKTQDVHEGSTYNLTRVRRCGYKMMIKAKDKDKEWETPWSIPYTFDADKDHNALALATIITPLLIVSLAALLLVCWRKNKNSIFPKVPKPRDLLSDISDNNNKSNVPNLYIPAEEEENCKITLVVDAQNNKLDS